jgi:CheY-like chemotaxis protein
MANNKAVIDIIAPNARTYNMLEFVLQQQGKGRFELGRGSRPDLVVLDVEQRDDWAAFRKYRGRFSAIPAVLLLNRQEEFDSLPEADRTGMEFILLKPFAVKDFLAKVEACLAAIAAARGESKAAVTASGTAKPSGKPGVAQERTLPLQISSQAAPQPRRREWGALESEETSYPCVLKTDIDMTDDAAVQRIWLKPDDRLLGHLGRALAKQATTRTPACLALRDGMRLHLAPNAKSIWFSGGDASLLELAALELGEGEVTLAETPLPTDARPLETEAFLWKLALYTYRGLLPAGTLVNQPVYLKYWPNLTRFESTPHAMRIAALLNRQPVPLAFVVRILGLPQRHVFNFYAAAHAAGYAGPAVREVDRMLLPAYPDGPVLTAINGAAGAATLPGRKVM